MRGDLFIFWKIQGKQAAQTPQQCISVSKSTYSQFGPSLDSQRMDIGQRQWEKKHKKKTNKHTFVQPVIKFRRPKKDKKTQLYIKSVILIPESCLLENGVFNSDAAQTLIKKKNNTKTL